MSQTGLPTQPGPERDLAILRAVDTGALAPSWVPVTSSANGHTATFYVLQDAMKLGGVRISTSARILQQIADKLSASLMTPKLLDLAFQQAQVVIPPCPLWPADETTEGMDKESALMDARVAGRPGLVAPIGKNWVLSNMLTAAKPGHAALYGWAVAPEFATVFKKANVPTYKGVTAGIQNIQPLATPHDIDYVDYAMLNSLVKRQCVVDGVKRDLWDVMRDPQLCALVSHEGPLKVLRQPGVIPMQPLGTGATSLNVGEEGEEYDFYCSACGGPCQIYQ